MRFGIGSTIAGGRIPAQEALPSAIASRIPIGPERDTRARHLFRRLTPFEMHTARMLRHLNPRRAPDTLIIKVLLGTFGCLPACHTYFIAGFKASGFKYSYLNPNFVCRSLLFAGNASRSFAPSRCGSNPQGGFHYPLMKSVDMHLWKTGYDLGLQQKTVRHSLR